MSKNKGLAVAAEATIFPNNHEHSILYTSVKELTYLTFQIEQNQML